MPVEEIIRKIDEQRTVILKALNEQNELVGMLRSADAEEYDWISVRKASDILGVSANVIYNKINSGALTVKHIESKKFVRKSEILEIDDRYGS